MATSSTNAKDKTKELVGAFNDLARSYNHLSEEQQRSDFGKAMSQSLTQLQQRIRETKEEVGISLTEEMLEFVARIKRRRSFIDIYFVKADFSLEDCVLQKEEVEEKQP